MKIHRALACSALCCLCFVAKPQTSAKLHRALSPLPPDSFEFTGNWECAGIFRGGKSHRASFVGQVVAGAKWLQLDETDIEPPTSYVARYLIGFDSERNQLIEFDANSFGAAIYTSDIGWKDGQLVLTSPASQKASARYAADRFLFSIAGQDAFTVDWQISTAGSGNWVQSDHLTCHRPSVSHVVLPLSDLDDLPPW